MKKNYIYTIVNSVCKNEFSISHLYFWGVP